MQKMDLKKRLGGYTFCLNDRCGQSGSCLRHILFAGLAGEEYPTLRVVNPKAYPAEGEKCVMFRPDRKVKMAWGLSRLYDDMPQRTARAIRATLEAHFSHTQYYRYRNGLIGFSPTEQTYVASVCRRFGWKEPPHFDDYTEEYEWE